jgi:hypothetical protein
MIMRTSDILSGSSRVVSWISMPEIEISEGAKRLKRIRQMKK